jgi:hypothetical protein
MMVLYLSTILMTEAVIHKQKYQVIHAADQNLAMHIMFVLVTMYASALLVLVIA